MAAGGSRFDDPSYKNWLRDTLALMYMKEGLEQFSDAQSQLFHAVLLTVCGTKCTSMCTFTDLKRDNKNKTWHMSCTTCDKWLKEVISYHNNNPFQKLSPKNTDPQKWHTDHWETSKLYMPYGCRTDTCAKDSDIQSVLSLFLNNCYFINSRHIGRDDLLDELVEIRNALFHSGNFQVNDTVVNGHLKKFIDFLQGMTGLTGSQRQSIKEAVLKIQELQANQLDLSLNKELELRALQQRHIGMEREMRSLESTVETLKKEQDNQETKLNSADNEIKRHEVSIKELQESKDRFEEFLEANDLKDDITRLSTQIQNVELQLSTHIQEVKKQLSTQRQEVETQLSTQRQEVETQLSTQRQEVETQLSTQIQEVKKHLSTHKQEVETQLSTQRQVVETQLSTQTQEVEKQLSTQRHEVKTEFKVRDESIDQLGNKVHTLEEQMKTKADISVASKKPSKKRCKDLQQVLIDHYKTTCLIVQNPAENNDIGLEYLCVEPTVRVLRQSKGRDGLKNVNDEATSLSCRNIFFNEEYRSRQIYITGEAGSGKSMMCKTLVRLWCEAHGAFLPNESEDSESDSEDEAFRMFPWNRRQARKQRHDEKKARKEENREILSHFTLLFYITLRDSLEYSVSEMIQSQILKYHASVKCLSASDVLSNECCLIIVDGLDEWVCPTGAPVPHFLNPGIPGRDIFNKTNVFLTTSRPWKFDILQLKSSEVDKHVELCALNEQSASKICSKVVKLLNKSQTCRKTKQEFFRTLKQKGLGHFKTIPVILIQLICLWFDNQELGKSQVQMYCSMLDLLLKKSQKNLCVQTTNTPTSVASETPLPKYITSHSHCQNHRQLIYCLSRFAFEALFDKTKENSLVFKSSQLEIYGVEQESIDMCLKSGILSQNKVLEKCSVSEKKISFLHKKFQEFLAAIFLASCDNRQDVVKHITDFCSTLDTCLEMSQVWLFVSEIRPDITRQLLDHLTRVVSADTKVKHYRQTLRGEGLIRDIQTCVTDCVIEGDNNGHSYDNIMLEDFYIDSDNTACHVERLLSCTPRSKVKSVYIFTRDIGESQLTSITGQLEDCKSVQKLHLFDLRCRIDVSTVTQIVNNNLDTLTCLDLSSNLTVTGELVSDICSISSKCLMALSLTVRLTHEHKEQILTRLPHSPTIKQLLLWLNCTEYGYGQCRPRIDLSTMTHIHTLELWCMSVDNLQSVSDCVEFVRLYDVILPVTTLCEFARRLSQTRRHVQVELDRVTVTEVRESRVDVKTFLLHTCHGLKVTLYQYDNSDNTWDILFTTSSQ